MNNLRKLAATAAAVTMLAPAFALTAQSQTGNLRTENVQRKADEVVWVDRDGVRIPLPPLEHPRLYLRSGDIPTLREKMKTPDGKAILAKLKKAAVPRSREEEAKATDRGFRYYAQMRGVTSQAQLDALAYLTRGDAASADRAITSMLDTLKTTSFGTKNDLSRASGSMLMVGAIVYDWCYDRMSDAVKQAYIREFVRIAGTMECHYPPKRTESVTGHGSEWMILRDMLSCGIAIYDEYPQMYDYVAEMIFRDYVPVRNYIYAGRNYHQGTGYVTVRYLNDLNSLWIFDRMGAGEIYSPEQRFVLYDLIYRRRPDGQVLPAGDVNPARRENPQTYAMPAMLAASYWKDPLLMYEYERRPSVETHMLILELLWRDFDLKGKSPEGLPLSRYSGTPFGWMIARTGWDGDAALAEMKIGEHWFGNHQHLDGGTFQIYYRGPLAIDSGSYQGSSGGYNSPHNKNYFKRTIAHNSLLVYDPSEKFACWNYGGADKTEFAENDGGQRMPGDRWESCRSFADLLSEDYTVGQVLAHGFGPDPIRPEWTLLQGDITQAYSPKVESARRSFVFLNLREDGGDVPAAMVIYDRVKSSDSSFRKYWLLHSIEEPQTGASEFTVERTGNGDSGKLVCRVLLPESDDLHMEKVGGRGKEFYVFGKNWPNAATTRPDPCNERGAWRVELSPVTPKKEDCFLNVIQLSDRSVRKGLPVSRIRGEGSEGAIVGDRAVVFAGDCGRSAEGYSFEIGASAAKFHKTRRFQLLATGLAEGEWRVERDGRPVGRFSVNGSDGTIYIPGASAGKYAFIPERL